MIFRTDQISNIIVKYTITNYYTTTNWKTYLTSGPLKEYTWYNRS